MIKQGDKLKVFIQDYGVEGEGVAKVDGFVIFVPFALKGEEVFVRVEHVKKGFAYAVLLEILSPSPYRVTPPCNRFTRCGGCDILNMDYKEQLQFKKQSLAVTLLRNARLQLQIQDVVPSAQFAYRNKLAVPFGTVNGKTALGFYRKNTHKIVSVTKCFLEGEWAEILMACVLDYVSAEGLSAYDEDTRKGVLRHLYARYEQGFLSVALVVTRAPKRIEALEKRIAARFPSFALYLNYNRKPTNVILGEETVLVGGKEQEIEVNGLIVQVHPLSFLQVNDAIRDAIYRKVMECVNVKGGSVVIDAYAGVGMLGCILAKEGCKVYNLEIVKEAVADGDKLVLRNGLTERVLNECCDSAKRLPALMDELRTDLKKCAVFTMNLQQEYFDKIVSGEKTYELRLYNKTRKRLKVRDSVCFEAQDGKSQVLCEITSLTRFNSFESLFKEIPLSACGFANVGLSGALEIMNGIYSKQEQSEYEAVAIGVRVIEPRVSVVLDPPRKGCDERVLQAIIDAKVPTVCYVSCNPATLARDLAFLSGAYTIDFVEPYDMFPNTRHVETLCMLRKQ